MSQNITVARVVSSRFEPETRVFRRKVIGADGFGYQFVRSVRIDRDNFTMESAVAHDVRQWLRETGASDSAVIALAPKVPPRDKVRWLPEIHVARPTRYYWLPDRQQVHARVVTRDDQTYNLFTPLFLLRDLIDAFDTHEMRTRSEAYGETPDGEGAESNWGWDDLTPH